MPHLRPLRFRDAIIDSPAFRDNLKMHSKYLRTKSKRVMELISATEGLFDAINQMKKAHENLKRVFLNYDDPDYSDEASASSSSQVFEAPYLLPSDSIQSLNDTDDDEIKTALPVIANLMEQMENSKATVLGPIRDIIVTQLGEFRTNWLSSPKTCLKTYNNEKANFLQKVEKYVSAKPKECTQEMDEAMSQDRRAFMKRTMDYVRDIHTAKQLLRSMFIQNAFLLTKMIAMSYQKAHEDYLNNQNVLSSIIAAVQRSQENFPLGCEDKLMNTSWEVIQTVEKTTSREGYLYVQGKKIKAWTEHFCVYSHQERKLSLLPFSRSRSLSFKLEADYYTVQSCLIRPPDQIDRRFCFDVKVVGNSQSKTSMMTLQAESQADLDEWIRVMGGTSSPSDIPQENRLTSQLVDVLRQLIEKIESKDLEMEGLYRVSGSTAKVNALVKDALKPSGLSEESLDDYSVHILAGAVKQIFRSLNEPLLNYHLHAQFCEAMKCPEKVQLNEIKKLLAGLPSVNYDLLRLCITHLSKVTESSKTNKMSASNLGLVFAPTLMHLADESSAVIEYNKQNATIVQFFIENCRTLFPDENTDSESQPEAAVASQLVESPMTSSSSMVDLNHLSTTAQAKDDACSVASEGAESMPAVGSSSSSSTSVYDEPAKQLGPDKLTGNNPTWYRPRHDRSESLNRPSHGAKSVGTHKRLGRLRKVPPISSPFVLYMPRQTVKESITVQTNEADSVDPDK